MFLAHRENHRDVLHHESKLLVKTDKRNMHKSLRLRITQHEVSVLKQNLAKTFILHLRDGPRFPILFSLQWFWWWWFSCWVVSDSCSPMDNSPPGSSVHGILQARRLEWVAMPFSRGSSWPRSPALQADSLPTEKWSDQRNFLTMARGYEESKREVNNPFSNRNIFCDFTRIECCRTHTYT